MDRRQSAFAIEDIRRDLDLVVFRLERDGPAKSEPPTDPQMWVKERQALRQELEELRDRLADLAMDLGL
jgi:hypothetical protein